MRSCDRKKILKITIVRAAPADRYAATTWFPTVHRVVVALCLAAVSYFPGSVVNALTEGERDRPRPRSVAERLGYYAAARGPVILDNRSLSNAWRRTAENRDETAIAPNEPLTRAIRAGMSARSIAGLRIAEAGRKLLEEGDYARALVRIERSLDLDGNPYNYYYLALIHYRLANYQQALNFIEVAESGLHDHSAWLAELAHLRNVVRHTAQSIRFSDAQHDSGTTIKTAALNATDSNSNGREKTVTSANTGASSEPSYLLLFDLFFLSLCSFVFFAAVTSTSSLKPR